MKSSEDWRNLRTAAYSELARREAGGPLEWALAYRTINGQPMRLIPALHDIYKDDHPFLVIQKAAQVYCSELLINLAMWATDTGQGGRGNALFVMPTQNQMDDFSQARFDRAIAESDYLQSRLYPPPPGRQGPARMRLKRVGAGYLYFRGADNRRQLISVDADIVLLDEYDLMGEGVLEMAMKRLASSRLGWMRIASTPRYPEAGIHAQFLRSDQRYYFLKCPACNCEQKLEWEANVDKERFLIVCRRSDCRKPLDLWALGHWEAAAPGNSDVRGYHLNRLYSPLANLQQMVWESEATSPAAVQEFQNSVLGETFVPPGGSIRLNDLDACRRDYELTTASAEPSYMGVDVGNVLNVVIRQKLGDDGTRSRLLFAGEVATFEEVAALISTFNVKTGVIDEAPEMRAARAFVRTHREVRLGVARYTRNEPGCDSATEDGIRVHRVHRTWALEEVFHSFQTGAAELPQDARRLGGRFKDGYAEYYRQLMAVSRRLEQDAAGNWVSRYVDGGRPDHYAHAEAYCLVAMRDSRSGRIQVWSGPSGFRRSRGNSVSDALRAAR